ncbi:probable dehydrogenases with different specificities (related to short-chain alcohol dehydrogenases) [Rhynchosporium secalis]|uniref:Probable dehydrogenases with different specificities (Related to short-chain alcohol dehydrogenases) n=1 Tax=Rhynchosporium secalis TaxID=38038 RepID=A0A1E1MDN6_RHYSE|nr:probable dehydrogenases with different specificities (related to short-chain alcohol dehydrogenases) [Rhynchosporium secalis]
MADNNLSGRLALITGASSGIGAACAHSLAGRGMHLALTYSQNADGMKKIVDSIRASSPDAGKLKITMHQVDVGEVDETIKMFKEVSKQHEGKVVDVLVSNAGYGKRIVDIWDIPLSEFEKTININLRASFLLVKGVIEGMKAQNWGRIIFMSSIAAQGGGINGCHYASSKGGLTAMMRNLSSHLTKYNISVNDVAPALIGDTGMISNPDVIPGGVGTIPMGRLGEPKEVANVVTMLAETGFMTGQSLLISGGLK